jgi:hypothetical protein
MTPRSALSAQSLMTTLFALAAALSAAIPSQATMTPNLERGEQIIQRSLNEVCIIPKKITSGKYNDKDTKNEIALCQSDINGSTQNIAVCGKTSSTNPGVEFFQPPTGMTPVQVEAKNCVLSKTEDPKGELTKVAKYKNSTSCSYTPAIISYYHISRFLGHVNQVPVSVLRTMDMKRHISIGNKTRSYLSAKGMTGDTIYATWGSLLMYLNKGAASAKKDQLMTDDLKQSYGALSKNPRNEEKYAEMFHGGANQTSRAINFRDRSPTFKLIRSSDSLKSFLPAKFDAASVQKMVQMKNVADMVVMDTILSQEDRFGNLHFSEVYYYLENGSVQKSSSLKPEEIKAKNAVKVKEMMMKDNDCGVNRTNHLREARLVEAMNHISPETYQQLQKLNGMLATDQAKTFFKRETMMTENDFANLRANVNYAATILKNSCKKGSLKLDLDLDSHFANKALTTSCD